MKSYKVLYETIDGKMKQVIINNMRDKEAAHDYVFNNYPDCLQVISVL